MIEILVPRILPSSSDTVSIDARADDSNDDEEVNVDEDDDVTFLDIVLEELEELLDWLLLLSVAAPVPDPLTDSETDFDFDADWETAD